MQTLYKVFFRFRHSILKHFASFCRIQIYRVQGLRIGKKSYLSKVQITWPHKISIGSNCTIESGIYFKYDGIGEPGIAIQIEDNAFLGAGCEFNIRKSIRVGSDCLIASGCKFIDHDHGIALNQVMRVQIGPESSISIGDNVWLGANVVVLKGVTIGNGAIVAAGAVVTKSILSNEIWAGVPAKKIGERK